MLAAWREILRKYIAKSEPAPGVLGKKERPGKPSCAESKSWPSSSSVDQGHIRVGVSSDFLIITALLRSVRSLARSGKMITENVQSFSIESTDYRVALSSGKHHLTPNGENHAYHLFMV